MERRPLEISSREDLLNIVNNPEEDFILTDDITMEPGDLSKISQIRKFKGVLDGDGHTIRNIVIHSKYNIWDGFMGKNEGTVKNLNVNPVIRSRGSVGGICTKNYGTIKNCSVNGKLNGKEKVGGIAVRNKGEIIDCEVDSELKSREDKIVGGITAHNKSLVESCHSSGEIIGKLGVGGIVGKNGSKVLYCSSEATVKSPGKPNNSIGGIVGKNYEIIRNSYYHGEYKEDSISDMEKNGILVGRNSGKIINCYYLEHEEKEFELVGTENLGESENLDIKASIEEIEKAIIATKI